MDCWFGFQRDGLSATPICVSGPATWAIGKSPVCNLDFGAGQYPSGNNSSFGCTLEKASVVTTREENHIIILYLIELRYNEWVEWVE